jgi:hypothetical protein
VQLQDIIAGWLASAGYLVKSLSEGLPSAAEWGLSVSTPPPLQVRLRVIGLKGGNVVLSIAIGFSEDHMRMIRELKEEDRVKLSSRIFLGVLKVCPYCRLALQGGMASPTSVVAEILLDGGSVNKQRVLDDVARLVNVFFTVNSILWSTFPSAHGQQVLGRTGSGFM